MSSSIIGASRATINSESNKLPSNSIINPDDTLNMPPVMTFISLQLSYTVYLNFNTESPISSKALQIEFCVASKITFSLLFLYPLKNNAPLCNLFVKFVSTAVGSTSNVCCKLDIVKPP